MSAPAVLITDGTSGIGKATAEIPHNRGYRVAATGQRPEAVTRRGRSFPTVSWSCGPTRARSSTPTRSCPRSERASGSLTTLFLNARVSRPMTRKTADEAAYDEVLAVNPKGRFRTLVKALPLLSNGSSVIVTVGIGATRSLTGNSVAVGSHGAFPAMIPTRALELAPRRIRVNAVGRIGRPSAGDGGSVKDQPVCRLRSDAAASVLHRFTGVLAGQLTS